MKKVENIRYVIGLLRWKFWLLNLLCIVRKLLRNGFFVLKENRID